MPTRTYTNTFTGELVTEEYSLGSPVASPGDAKFLVALIGLVLSPWLYPLLTAAVTAVGMVAAEVADAMRLTGPIGLVAVAVPALFTFALGMRIEQRLGAFTPYRWLRHLLRLAVPGACLYLSVSDAPNAQSSSLLGGTIFVTVIALTVLWFAGRVRDDWHASLRAMRLRAASLDD